MGPTLRGAVVLEVGSDGLEPIRERLGGRRRPGSLADVRLAVHDDGRATFEVPMLARELARVAQAVGLATAVSVATSLAFDWMFYSALPAGFAVGVGWSAFAIGFDRRRLRAEARSFLRGLARG